MKFRKSSLVDIDEAALIKRLVADGHRRSRLFAIRGFPRNPTFRQRVPLTGLPQSPKGDVDILAWTPGKPEGAVAIEVKRIKARVGDNPSDTRVNKLQEFRRGIDQVNRLARIGFSQVYLWVFVLVDSRKRNAGKITYDGLTPPLSQQIAETISIQDLDARVGLIHHEFVQPMDYKPLDVGSFGGKLIRLPHESLQPVEVTAWVRGLSEQ